MKQPAIKISRKRLIEIALWTGLGALFVVFLFLFNRTLEAPRPADAEIGVVYEKARVLSVDKEDLAPDPDYPEIQVGKQWLTLVLTSGELKGRSTTAINYLGRVNNMPAAVDTRYVVSSYDGFVTTTVVNYSREGALYVLAGVFILLVLAFGRLKGLASILSLAFTLVCVVFLFLPMILRGVPPIPAALVVVVLSTGVTLLSLNGWCRKTAVAAVSCIVCTLMAGLIGWAFGAAASLTSLNTGDAEWLLFASSGTGLQVKDLLFAGILIAALGAVMDTAMSISSSLEEMKAIDPTLSARQLFRSGMNIGRDIMGTMTNTLILAFAGSSVNILLIFYLYAQPYIGLINLDLLVVELVKGLAGSIAVVLAIPVTAAAGARAMAA